jgi:hypothetical protein
MLALMGFASLYPSYENPPLRTNARCELICLACKRNVDASLRQINPTGKSLLIFRNRVKPGNQKYSA